MKTKLTILLLIIATGLRAQVLCHDDITNGETLSVENKAAAYARYDYSKLWLRTDNRFVFGINGKGCERILMKFLSITKSPSNPYEYHVTGKSSRKGKVRDFSGTITISRIQEFSVMDYGVDEERRNDGILAQGLLTAAYSFSEKTESFDKSTFSGTVQTLWYLDKNKAMQYNDIGNIADGYFNNGFTGIRTDATMDDTADICNWGDYRVPDSPCDFDNGASEFNVSEKYVKNGWDSPPDPAWWK